MPAQEHIAEHLEELSKKLREELEKEKMDMQIVTQAIQICENLKKMLSKAKTPEAKKIIQEMLNTIMKNLQEPSRHYFDYNKFALAIEQLKGEINALPLENTSQRAS